MTRAGLLSGDLTAQRVGEVVTVTPSLSILCAILSPHSSRLGQSWLQVGSQAPADRLFNGHLAWALDAEPQG